MTGEAELDTPCGRAMTIPSRRGCGVYETGFGVSGAGLADARHGPGLGRGLPLGAPLVRGGRRRAVAASVAADVRGAGKRADPDRERPARVARREPGGGAGA